MPPRQPARGELAGSPIPSIKLTPRVVGATVGRGTVAGPDMATISLTSSLGSQGTGSTTSVDIGRYQNPITTASPAHQASAPGQDTGGGGGVSASSQPVVGAAPSVATNAGAGPSTTPAAATSPAGGPGQAATAMIPSNGDGEIRSMTLRPPATPGLGHSGTPGHPGSYLSPADSTSNNNPPPNSHHDFTLTPFGYAMIGAPYSNNVQAINNSPNLKQVVWQITGAVQSQTYVNSMGSFTPQTSVVHGPFPDQGDCTVTYAPNSTCRR